MSIDRENTEAATSPNSANTAEHTPDDLSATEKNDVNGEATTSFETASPAPWITTNLHQQQFLLSDRHGEVHREDSMGNHWSVPWSDLMMSMFVLFAALVTSQLTQEKSLEYVERDKIQTIEKEVPSSEILPGDNIALPEPSFDPLMRINVFEQSQQAIREANIENVEIILMDDQSVKVSVQGPMFFDQGADTLKPDVKAFLSTLSGVIRQTSYKVNVIGHTDDKPISNKQFASNWELSLMRATQVTKHLIDEGQIDPARFTIMGRSQYEPATPNENDRFRSMNRRVEIIITREVAQAEKDQL